MARGGTARGEGEGSRGKRRGNLEGRKRGSRELGAGSGVDPDGVSGGGFGGGNHMAGGSPYPQGVKGLPGHRPRGVDVEGSGGDSKSPFHILHHQPRRPP